MKHSKKDLIPLYALLGMLFSFSAGQSFTKTADVSGPNLFWMNVLVAVLMFIVITYLNRRTDS